MTCIPNSPCFWNPWLWLSHMFIIKLYFFLLLICLISIWFLDHPEEPRGVEEIFSSLSLFFLPVSVEPQVLFLAFEMFFINKSFPYCNSLKNILSLIVSCILPFTWLSGSAISGIEGLKSRTQALFVPFFPLGGPQPHPIGLGPWHLGPPTSFWGRFPGRRWNVSLMGDSWVWNFT